MSISGKPYYEPGVWETRDIASSQVENISIDMNGTPCNIPKIVAIYNGRVIKTWAEGGGIIVAPDRLTISFDLNGEELKQAVDGAFVLLQFSFWRTGVVEFQQKIKVVKTYV